MPDLYLRESQILVLKAQIEVLDQIRRGAVIQTLEGRELDSMRQPDWATVETLTEEDRLPKSSGAERGRGSFQQSATRTTRLSMLRLHPTRSSKGRIRTTVKPTLRQPGREGFTKGSGL